MLGGGFGENDIVDFEFAKEFDRCLMLIELSDRFGDSASPVRLGDGSAVREEEFDDGEISSLGSVVQRRESCRNGSAGLLRLQPCP